MDIDTGYRHIMVYPNQKHWMTREIQTFTTLYPPAHSSHTFIVEEQEDKYTLRAVNQRKAAAPDDFTGWVLKDCADQLAGVFAKIFNQSLSQSTILPCPKSSFLVPQKKKSLPLVA